MWTVIDTPIDPLRLVEENGALTAVEFTPFTDTRRDGRPRGARADDHPVLAEAARQLGEYFASERQEFDLPLAPYGTEFQLRVWAQLREIPFGRTASYGEIAQRLGTSEHDSCLRGSSRLD